MHNEDFEKVLTFLTNTIPLKQVESIAEIFSKSDPTLALELLCTQIYEYDVNITQEIFSILKSLCIGFNVDHSYLEDIQGLVK